MQLTNIQSWFIDTNVVLPIIVIAIMLLIFRTILKPHSYAIYFVTDDTLYRDLIKLFPPASNPIWRIKRDMLGPNFSPIDDDDKKDKKKAFFIFEDKKQTDENSVIGVACRVKIPSTKEEGWITVYKGNSEFQGTDDEVCRKLVREFNRKYKENNKKITWQSYLTRENIIFITRIVVQYVLPMYINYQLNTISKNKEK